VKKAKRRSRSPRIRGLGLAGRGKQTDREGEMALLRVGWISNTIPSEMDLICLLESGIRAREHSARVRAVSFE